MELNKLWEEELTRIEFSVSVTYPDNALGTTIKTEVTTITTEIPCSFVTVGKFKRDRYESGWNINLYKKTQDSTQYPVTYTTTLYENGEEKSSNQMTINTSFSSLSFNNANVSNKETGSGYRLFSDVLDDLEDKWNNNFGNNGVCYRANIGRSGGVLSNAENILMGVTTNRPPEKVVIDAQISISNPKWYCEPSCGHWLGKYENPYELVSTMVAVPYGNSGGKQTDMEQPWSIRHYTLMNILSDIKYADGDGDKESEDRLDIVVALDGKKSPNITCSWVATPKYDIDNPNGIDLSNHTVNMKAIGYHPSVAIEKELGTFPLVDGSANFTYGNLAKQMETIGVAGGGYPDKIKLLFTTTFIDGETWESEIFNNVSAGTYPYEGTSTPSGVPSITTTTQSNDGDNEDDGDGGHGGGSGGSGVNAHSILTTTYAISPTRCKQLGDFLWGATFLEEIKLLNNSPIENILSVKLFAFPIVGGDDVEIEIGNVPTGVNGKKIENSYSYSHVLGTVHCEKKYNNFLDFAPYTNIYLYLPYYGIAELDGSMYMDRDIKIEYIIDVVVGECTINVYANNILANQYGCSCGVDIPISASNRAQIESAFMSNMLTSGISSPANLLEQSISFATTPIHYTTSGHLSSATSMYAYNAPMLILNRPILEEINGFSHSYGKLCLQNKQIKTLRGFTKMSNIDITGIPATLTELEEIRDILTTGFYA